MAAKATLRDSRTYTEVGIGPDKSKTKRVYEAILRELVRTVGQGRLEVRGNRLVSSWNNSSNQSPSRRNSFRNDDRRDRQRSSDGRSRSPDGRNRSDWSHQGNRDNDHSNQDHQPSGWDRNPDRHGRSATINAVMWVLEYAWLQHKPTFG